MITIKNTVISDDVAEQFFACNLEKCKGACCVEGDLGAPLEDSELEEIASITEQVKPYLSPEGIREIEKQGPYVLDEDDEYSTPTIGGKECAYAVYDDKGILKCGIEQAYFDGKVSYRKPISCQLYPIRITKYEDFDAVNYDRWDICSPACDLGAKLSLPVYKFLKDPLIRKYGEDWYAELENELARRNIEGRTE